jgi:uncharacterized protein (DUF2236 family)
MVQYPSSQESTMSAASPRSAPSPLGPQSFTWRDFGTYKYTLVLPQAFVLQAAHPVINGAITAEKKYLLNPWQRARDSVRYLWPLVYSRPVDVQQKVHQLRELHRPIKGVDRHGQKYHGLDPEAFSWVHVTGFDAMLRLAEVFGKTPTPDERSAMFAEWQAMGRLLGIQERYIAATEAEYWQYYHRMIDERLVWDDALDDLLSSQYFANFPRPEELSFLPQVVWRILIRPAGWVGHKVCKVTLPTRFRDKFNVQVSALDRAVVTVVAAAVRLSDRVLPEVARYIPLAYHARIDLKKHPEAWV